MKKLSKTALVAFMITATALLGAQAHADSGKGKGNAPKEKYERHERDDHDDRGHHARHDGEDDDKAWIRLGGDDRAIISAYIRDDYRRHCPPGLAKKNPACVPPGLAKQSYNVGERMTGDYILLANPQDYGMPDGTYYANDGYLYRVDPDTLEVLAIMGLVDQLLR